MEEPKPTEAPSAAPPTNPPRGKLANLVRNPKGVQPEHLKRLNSDPERVQITKKTLMSELTKLLHQKDGEKLRKLAGSIIDNAIKGNSACLSFLAERLAPIEEKQGGGKVVFEGIKLEVVSSSLGPTGSSKTSIALVRGSESHSGATPLDAPNTSLAESEQGPRDSVILEQRDVRSPSNPSDSAGP